VAEISAVTVLLNRASFTISSFRICPARRPRLGRLLGLVRFLGRLCEVGVVGLEGGDLRVLGCQLVECRLVRRQLAPQLVELGGLRCKRLPRLVPRCRLENFCRCLPPELG
jgi:hypothetical protein